MKPEFPVNRIYCGDSRNMQQILSEKVALVVCSPPYNVRKPYSDHDDDMPLEEYSQLLLDVWKECFRILRPGGRLCVNVAGVWRQPYLPLHALIWEQLVNQLEFQMRGEIIWDKGASVGVSTAWGSFASPSNPTLRDVHEFILVASRPEVEPLVTHEMVSVFSKGGFGLDNVTGSTPDITYGDFVEYTKSVWEISEEDLRTTIWDMPTESARKLGHPAPFPTELPRRLIRLYTYPGDVVVDPFAGSGSTCLAAQLTGRYYIGYDVDKRYVKIARDRLKSAADSGQLPMNGLPRRKRQLRPPRLSRSAGSPQPPECHPPTCGGERYGSRSRANT